MIEVLGHDVVGIRAENPGPLTLSGTNTWIVGRDPAWVVDPGPSLPGHLAAVGAEVERRGGLGGIALTHDHVDHAEGVGALRERVGSAPVGAARGEVEVRLGDGEAFGPLETVSSPGHAPDHLAFAAGGVGFCGDAVLGEGTAFLAPDPGALRGYLDALERLRDRRLAVLCPGHGPVIADPEAKLDEYLHHRHEREERLLAALALGRRSVDDLLDEAWADSPPALRPAAAMTLAAHLEKLAEEGRLPSGVERPRFP